MHPALFTTAHVVERWAEEKLTAATTAGADAHSIALSFVGRVAPRAEEDAARAAISSLEGTEIQLRQEEDSLRGLAAKLRVLGPPVNAAPTPSAGARSPAAP